MLNKGWCLCSGRLQKRCENAPGQKGKVTKVRILYHLTWCCIALISDTDKLYLRWSDIQLRATFFFFQQSNRIKVPPLSKLQCEKVCPSFYFIIFLLVLQYYISDFYYLFSNEMMQLQKCLEQKTIIEYLKREPPKLSEVILYPINIGSVRFINPLNFLISISEPAGTWRRRQDSYSHRDFWEGSRGQLWRALLWSSTLASASSWVIIKHYSAVVWLY